MNVRRVEFIGGPLDGETRDIPERSKVLTVSGGEYRLSSYVRDGYKMRWQGEVDATQPDSGNL